MADTENSNSSRVGLGSLVFLVFLVLKLTDAIDWSWWWVTAPLWIPTGLLVVGAIVAGIASGLKDD